MSKLSKTLQSQRFRTATLERVDSADDADSYRFGLSFSSEEPYLRWDGFEILGHAEGEMDTTFIGSGRAPLLVQHATDDIVGIVEKTEIVDHRGKAVVRFGKSARANEIRQDVLDGIRTNVSVGYYVKNAEWVNPPEKGSPGTYRVTQWKPFEVSLVSIPADESVGVGRSQQGDDPEASPIEPQQERQKQMPEEKKVETPTQPEVDVKVIEANAEIRERSRIASITELCEQHRCPELAKNLIRAGKTIEEARAAVLDKLIEKQDDPLAQPQDVLSKKEAKDVARFSFVKAIRDIVHNGKLSGVEEEMHQEACKQQAALGFSTRGQIAIPLMVLNRDLTVTTESADVVATGVSANFIELLRNKMMVQALGARFLTGLTGDVLFPRISAGATAAWEGENDAGSEQTQTINQVKLSPNRVGCYTEISKQILIQSTPDIESMVRDDLATAIALAIDSAAINGTGSSNQPTGILKQTGIGAVVCGDPDGAALTWTDIVALETEVATDNADIGNLAYLTNAAVRGALKGTEKAANTAQFIWDGSTINGYRAEVSNQVPSNGTKGAGTSLSSIIFGNWGDCLVGQWGGLDMVVDPYSLATTNLLRITVNTYADCDVRHVESFAAATDVVT